jgi:hypothetical protein
LHGWANGSSSILNCFQVRVEKKMLDTHSSLTKDSTDTVANTSSILPRPLSHWTNSGVLRQALTRSSRTMPGMDQGYSKSKAWAAEQINNVSTKSLQPPGKDLFIGRENERNWNHLFPWKLGLSIKDFPSQNQASCG